MQNENHFFKTLAVEIISAALLLLVILACLKIFIGNVEPAEHKHSKKIKSSVDGSLFVKTLSDKNYAELFEAIKKCTQTNAPYEETRRAGSQGCAATAELIEETLKNCGFEVMTQQFSVTIPQVSHCRLLHQNGAPINNIYLYPLEPSGLLPMSLPTNGIEGKLVFASRNDVSALQGENPEDTIVITYFSSDFDWKLFASLGVKAILLLEDIDMQHLKSSSDSADPWATLMDKDEISYPIFLARGGISDLIGKRLRLECNVKWQSVPTKNIFGKLKGNGTPDEALLVSTYYNSFSPFIGAAPGAEEAISVAAFLNLAQAFSSYKGALKRDVIFIATSAHSEYAKGARSIMDALETNAAIRVDKMCVKDRLEQEKQFLNYVNTARALISNETFWSGDPAKVKKLLADNGEDFKTWFAERVKQVLGEINIADSEETLRNRISYLLAGSPIYREGFDASKATDEERRNPTNSHPLLVTYLKAREQESISGNMVSIQPHLLCSKPETASPAVRKKMNEAFDRLFCFHTTKINQLRDALAVQELLGKYENTILINLQLYSGGSLKKNSLAVLTGIEKIGSIIEPQVSMTADLLKEHSLKSGAEMEVVHWSSLDAAGSKANPCIHNFVPPFMESKLWATFGHLAFTFINNSFFPQKLGTPEDNFDNIDLTLPEKQIVPIGKALFDIAGGATQLKTLPQHLKYTLAARSVKVLGNAGADSLSPSHPFGEKTYVAMYAGSGFAVTRGVKAFLIEETNPYGQCYLDNFFAAWGAPALNAMRFDEDGKMLYTKNQASSFSISGKKVTIPMFRCSPVSIYSYNNPVTMQAFKGLGFISKQSLSAPDAYLTTTYINFLKPDFTFYVVLKDGAYDNKEILDNRAFILNADPEQPPIQPEEPEIFGEGYLVANTPFLGKIAEHSSASMLRTNLKRINLQKKYNLTDNLMLDFHNKGMEFLKKAREAFNARDLLQSTIAASKSFAYALNNHPVIRNKISQAIIGILWYLALLVPFAFFFEKLIFGFTDIRKQLLANAAIFLIVFFLLKFFHPAFQMVRSSLMILLGFIILLLSLIIILMVSGKFKQNIKELRSKEGSIEGADINRGGVIGTAFMLGLNNMRRRKVRTALTAITLILLTFVMICFTSISSNLVDSEVAIGKSQWNGILYRKDYFAGIRKDEFSAIKEIYGRIYPITTRTWLMYNLDAGNVTINNAEFTVDREIKVGDNTIQKRVTINAILKLEPDEPQFSCLDQALLTTNGWFPHEPSTREEIKQFLKSGKKSEKLAILPDSVAQALHISTNDVNSGTTYITVNNALYRVLGIIDSQLLEKTLDPDGRSILPVDLNSVQNIAFTAQGALIPEDAQPLSPSQVILVNAYPPYRPSEAERIVSLAVLFPKTPYKMPLQQKELPALGYKEQREVVTELLERTQESAYYSIDGIAYHGARKRAKTTEGLLELIIPLIIAGLTVFNTMRSSVYERREEIYVYNAVGIAPNHVFFMFMAEALVYAVVGALLGYLLSQSVGTILTALGMTGGLNMNYSSIETIYASLAIIIAVLLSTLIPARDAARLASPAEERKWKIPKPEGDVLVLNLPFTFTPKDRLAIIEYFRRWMDANGEGSDGSFFSSRPEIALLKQENGSIVPAISATIWLKPYDMGVSQKMEITLPVDKETGEFIAQIKLTRLSGSLSTWMRILKPFLSILRKQFLNWRAATQQERSDMYEEAKNLITKTYLKEAEQYG
jgi:ABC-type antimicrobial peptide transport system permease subunit